jgi:hypothetical protein
VVNFVQVLVAYSIAYFYYYLVPRKLSSPSFDNDNGNGYTLLPSADYQMVDMSSRPTMHQVTVENIAWSNTLTFMLNGTPISLVNPDPAQLLCCVGRERVCVWELVCVRCVCVLCVWRHTVAVLHTKAWPPGAVLKQSSTHCKIPRVRINGVCRVVAAHKLW